jgi:succinoglycan biosynthesis transport protein ExoP
VVTRYLDVLRKGWAWIFALVVVGGCVGYGVSLATTKIYQATTQVFVTAQPGIELLPVLMPGNQFGQAQVQSLTAVVNSPMVTGRVINRLGLQITRSELAGKITADAPPGKVLINIHVTDRDPVVATRLANVVAKQFSEVAGKFLEATPSGQPESEVEVVHPATVPSAPISPDRQLYTELGLLAGLALGLAVVSLRAARRARPEQAGEPALAG